MLDLHAAGPVRLFEAPPVGRRILAGFSYIQRINKNASTRVWFPRPIEGRGAEWAAVRQVEIFQEAGNVTIEDLKVEDIAYAYKAWGKMRAGGYRVTVMTLGHYEDTPWADDLCVLDQKLQEEVTRLINFLYMNEASAAESQTQNEALRAGAWSLADSLPHVAMALGEKKLFKPHKVALAEDVFFEILGRLPSRCILHDVAMGLALPDATKDHGWTYIARPEYRAASFFGALGTTLGEPITHQMRAHGGRMTDTHEAWHRQMARQLAA